MYEELKKPATTIEEAAKRLKLMVEVLRGEEGCPWDRAQTHESLRRAMIEEAYEAVDAIDRGDSENLKEELGDVLLQVFMHSEIASEKGNFNFTDVANETCEKMIRRHPHIFSKKSDVFNAFDVDNTLELWENVKRIEKDETTQNQSMRSVPRALPALMRSEKIQLKAREVGFDWDSASEALNKTLEEIQELIEAYEGGGHPEMFHELGDALFALTNVARFLGISSEEALNKASDRFISRFTYMETAASDSGRSLRDMDLAEMDEFWEKAKSVESSL